jgi:hypothetical protein
MTSSPSTPASLRQRLIDEADRLAREYGRGYQVAQNLLREAAAALPDPPVLPEEIERAKDLLLDLREGVEVVDGASRRYCVDCDRACGAHASTCAAAMHLAVVDAAGSDKEALAAMQGWLERWRKQDGERDTCGDCHGDWHLHSPNCVLLPILATLARLETRTRLMSHA